MAGRLLDKGKSSIDAVVEGVAVSENDPKNTTVGFGGAPDRSGKVTRQFKADLIGSFKDNIITLDEDFYRTDGEKQKRTWKIKKIDNNNYIGTAPDVVGEATGVQYGSAFKFKYDLLVPFKNKNIKVSFDDWIFKQDEKVAINRATLTKFGFKVGELTVFFMRD